MEPVKPHSTSTAYRRQRQIEDCLYENLLHIPYQSISVADLCRQVGISRKAFYNYYHDKDACLAAIIHRTLQECSLNLTIIPDEASALDTSLAILEFWRERKTFLDIMMRNNLMFFLQTESIYYILNEDRGILDLLNTPYVESDNDILACYVSSHYTLILQWYLRGFDTPAEEMAKKMLRIIHVPLITPAGFQEPPFPGNEAEQ